MNYFVCTGKYDSDAGTGLEDVSKKGNCSETFQQNMPVRFKTCFFFLSLLKNEGLQLGPLDTRALVTPGHFPGLHKLVSEHTLP